MGYKSIRTSDISGEIVEDDKVVTTHVDRLMSEPRFFLQDGRYFSHNSFFDETFERYKLAVLYTGKDQDRQAGSVVYDELDDRIIDALTAGGNFWSPEQRVAVRKLIEGNTRACPKHPDAMFGQRGCLDCAPSVPDTSRSTG